MRNSENFTVKLYGMKDCIVIKDDTRYVFRSFISKRLNNIDSPVISTVRRRWLWLVQFNINMRKIYGIDAVNIDSMYLKDKSGTIKFEFYNEPGTDSIE